MGANQLLSYFEMVHSQWVSGSNSKYEEERHCLGAISPAVDRLFESRMTGQVATRTMRFDWSRSCECPKTVLFEAG